MRATALSSGTKHLLLSDPAAPSHLYASLSCHRRRGGRPVGAASQPEGPQPVGCAAAAARCARRLPSLSRRCQTLIPYPIPIPTSTPTGVRLPLPEGYAGAVLECRAQEAPEPAAGGNQEDAPPGSGAPLPPGWAATAAFSHLHYYNHDSAPLQGDPLRRCMDWAGMAAAVHAPVDPAAVTTAAAAAADAGAAQQQQQVK